MTKSAAQRLAELVQNRAALHEELLLSRQVEQELLETLAREVLDSEPLFEDVAPVVAFNKRYGGPNSEEYSFAAVGIPIDSDGTLTWYVTGPRSANQPRSWEELVSFMGVVGLSSLEVLR